VGTQIAQCFIYPRLAITSCITGSKLTSRFFEVVRPIKLTEKTIVTPKTSKPQQLKLKRCGYVFLKTSTPYSLHSSCCILYGDLLVFGFRKPDSQQKPSKFNETDRDVIVVLDRR
jgi:hypothetical protein